MKISNCCGVRPFKTEDFSTEEIGICPKCKEHCEYLEYCDECGEEIKDCVCDEDIAYEKLREEIEADDEITQILTKINNYDTI